MSFLDLEKSASLNRHYEVVKALQTRLRDFHKRPLHPGQIALAKAFFVEKKRIIMAQFGRSCGKSEAILYISWLYAMLNPNSLIYIICPEIKQGKKIYWVSRRLQEYGPPEYLVTDTKSDATIELTNRSKIIVDGCENYNSLRGIKPHLVFYDEFQDHSKEFDLEVMRPNLLAKSSALVIAGTPPKNRSAYYVEFRENLLKQINEGNKTRGYYQFPTSLNPIMDIAELDQIKKELIESGNEVIWRREYLGELCFGDASSIFPVWSPSRHIKHYSTIKELVARDRHRLRFYTICDPGSSSCFGVLFAVHNPNTSQMFIVDELYEKDRKKTNTKTMWEAIRQKEEEIYPGAPKGTWRRVYDEAAAWFAQEIQSNYRENVEPTRKQSRDHESDISLIKMMMATPECLHVSNKCHWLQWEIESYITDENGKYPKDNDHLIDCLRYLVAKCNFSFVARDGNTPFRRVEMNGDGVVVNEGMLGQLSDWSENVLADELREDYMGEGYDA